MSDFQWPCDLREAHGPHLITGVELGEMKECPGVKAHPNTMIGREATKA